MYHCLFFTEDLDHVFWSDRGGQVPFLAYPEVLQTLLCVHPVTDVWRSSFLVEVDALFIHIGWKFYVIGLKKFL